MVKGAWSSKSYLKPKAGLRGNRQRRRKKMPVTNPNKWCQYCYRDVSKRLHERFCPSRAAD